MALARPSRRQRQIRAETVALEWLRQAGFSDVRVASTDPQDGANLEGSAVMAKVHTGANATDRPAVQVLAAEAAAGDKTPVFFSAAGYTEEADRWARTAKVALFRFDQSGEPLPGNPAAAVVASRAMSGESGPDAPPS